MRMDSPHRLKLAAAVAATLGLAATDMAVAQDAAADAQPAAKAAAPATADAKPAAKAPTFEVEKAPEGSEAAKVLDAVAGALEGMFSDPDAPDLLMSGPMRAEEDGSDVKVTMPDVKLQFDKDEVLEVGTVVLTVTPTDDGMYDFSASLPTTLVGMDGGEKLMETTISSYTATGTWWPELMSVTDMDIRFEGVTIHGREKAADDMKEVGTIDTVLFSQDMEEDGNGLWEGPFEYSVSGIRFAPPDEEEEVDIGKVGMTGKVGKIDAKVWAKMQQILGFDPSKPYAEPSEAEIKEFVAFAKDANWGTAEYTFAIEDLNVRGQDGSSEGALKEGHFGMSWDASEKLGSLGVTFGFSGVEAPSEDMGLPQQLLPRDSKLDIALTNAPVREMLGAMLPAMSGMYVDAEMDESKIDENAIMAAIMQAQPKIMLNTLEARAEMISAHVDGAANVNPQSPIPVVGAFTGRVEGLDATLQYLANTQDLPKNEAQQATAGLMFLKGMGKPEGDAYIYDIKLTENGEITVNGQPMNALMQQ